MTELYHPANDPFFNRHATVWYLSHPLAPDDRYTFQQNLDHTLHMLRLVLDEGYHAIAPYHTHCLVLDDQNHQHRCIGLETDVGVARALGRIILCGHKFSSGMQIEAESCIAKINLIGLKDWEAQAELRNLRGNER